MKSYFPANVVLANRRTPERLGPANRGRASALHADSYRFGHVTLFLPLIFLRPATSRLLLSRLLAGHRGSLP
jgi:hypothetical protein